MADVRLRALRPFFNSPFMDEDLWSSFLPQSQNLDMYETNDEVVVKAPMPGISADNVDVTFEDGVLRITGREEENQEEKNKKKVVHSEYRTRSFDYTVTLPRAIDPSKMSAEIENGIVKITAPLAEASKPKKITVKAKGK